MAFEIEGLYDNNKIDIEEKGLCRQISKERKNGMEYIKNETELM